MSIEEWEKTLSEKEIRKVSKHTQDQRKILKRILETDLGLVEEQEVYDEIKFRKSSKGSAKFLPSLRFNKSISAPDLSQGYRQFENTNNPFPVPFNYNAPNFPSPPIRKFQSSFPEDMNSNNYRRMNSEYDGNDGVSINRDSQYDNYKPFHFRQNFSYAFLDECSYSIERKKMNDIADNVDKFFNGLPKELRNLDAGIDLDTERLKDSTYYSHYRGRRSSSPRYNCGLLNELFTKAKSLEDVSVEDLKLVIFLIQRTISDMKSVGRTGRGYNLLPYELRRRGFKVNPKELLDFLERLKSR